ncbi:MAG: hypothetical protein FWE89_00960 [Syntrophaceae bacterium]|nr:hypothetical protein [Syntrophaceae bacterium]
MLPESLEQWCLLIAAAVSGLFIGQWIRRQRRKKDPYAPTSVSQPRQRLSKKARRKRREGA